MIHSATRRAPRVLVADDDEGVRRSLALLLREAGYAVLEAADGQEALELGSQAPVDLLLTDLNMPRLGGEALARALLDRQPDLEVLLMSGGATAEELGLPFEAKPLIGAQVLLRVSELLGRDPDPTTLTRRCVQDEPGRSEGT